MSYEPQDDVYAALFAAAVRTAPVFFDQRWEWARTPGGVPTVLEIFAFLKEMHAELVRRKGDEIRNGRFLLRRSVSSYSGAEEFDILLEVGHSLLGARR